MVFVDKAGREYEMRVGARCQVGRGKAYQTSGGLKRRDLRFNPKTGRWVSLAKSDRMRKIGRQQLEAAGYGLFKPGQAGQVTRVTKRRGSKAKASSAKSSWF